MFSLSWISCIFPKKSAVLFDLSSSADLLETNTVDISGTSLLEKEEENLKKKDLANENTEKNEEENPVNENKEENLDKAADEEVALLFNSNIETTYTYFTTLNDTQENQV